MKQRSIKTTLKTRYWSSVIFYISIVIYGVIAIIMYGKNDMGVAYAGLIIVSNLLAICCMLVKAEALLKYADPLNSNNQRKYIYILFIELLEMISVYALCTNISEGKKFFSAISFFIVVTIIFYTIMQIHRKIFNEYNAIRDTKQINNLLLKYSTKYNDNIDIEWYFMRFVYFAIYVLSLLFIYKYTLYNWFFTISFLMLNTYILWKLHWKGIVVFVKYKKLYFFIVCFISSVGIVVLKLIYDGYIILNIFKNRDEQEYLMVFVLFYLPIVYYGKRVSEIYNIKKIKWVE